MLLEEFDSPFCIKDLKPEFVSVPDCYLFLFICGLDWETGPAKIMEFIENDNDSLKKLHEDFEGLEITEYDWKLMEAYLSDYRKAPRIWPSKSKDGSNTESVSAIPWTFKVAADLINFTTLSESRAWNMPLNLAVAYRVNVADNNGHDVKNEELIEKLKASLK